ncbi:Gustatory receptor 11, partial [Frankliniella occidentalis]
RPSARSPYATSPLAPVVNLVAWLGFLPLAAAQPHLPSAAVRSSLLYCVVLYAVTCWSQSLVWWDQALLLDDAQSRWDERLFSLQILWMLLPQVLTPWLWLCAAPIRDSLLRFADYERVYASITNDTLAPRLGVRRRLLQNLMPVILICAIVTLACAINYIQVRGTRVPIRWAYFPAALSAIMTQGMLTILFTTYSYQLKVAAGALCQYLQQ